MSNDARITKNEAENSSSAEQTRCGQCYRPNVDIIEKSDELLVVADVPGATGDSIDVDFEDGALTIRAAVAPREDNRNYLLREYGVGDFFRTFRVSEAIDAGKISAQCADGVLTLHLPKAEAAKPRKIAVQSA
ncbi:MAG: Hsp20/alpha crystallin family protein [Pirellulales bacterium]|nr:Hsp20/alpha crystallin family protein [Pirellulales bacterium]